MRSSLPVPLHDGDRETCKREKMAVIVIVSYLPSTAVPGLAQHVLELSLKNIEMFWPAGEVDVIIADNNAADPGSQKLLQSVIQRNLSSAYSKNVRIIPNHDAANGWRYIFGALRMLVRELGWELCIPYDYMTLLHHTSALLKPLRFPGPGEAGAFEYRPFLFFDLQFFGVRQREYSEKVAASAGITIGQHCQEATFGPAWVSSRSCLQKWIRGHVFDEIAVDKHVGAAAELLTGILGSELCGSCRQSYDGNVFDYPNFMGPNYIASAAELGPGRVFLKLWGANDR